MPRNEWVQNYATQILERWDGWGESLNINDSHVERLENELNVFFEAIEKKVWIELIF